MGSGKLAYSPRSNLNLCEPLQDTTDQIDNVRSTILLRQALQHWHAAYDRSLDMAATADQHRKMAKQAAVLKMWLEKAKGRSLNRREDEFCERQGARDIEQSFRIWRAALNERRTRRWEKNMAKREKAFLLTKDARLTDEAWQVSLKPWSTINDQQVWRDRTLSKVDGATAEQFWRRNTTRKLFNIWLKRTVLERQARQFMTKQDDDIRAADFQLWRQRATLASSERMVQAKGETALITRVWSQWRLQL